MSSSTLSEVHTNTNTKSSNKISLLNGLPASYEKAIDLLRKVVKRKSPLEKMQTIANVSIEITECINVFWNGRDSIVSSTLLNLDADDIMSIFIYVIIKAKIYDLLIHSKMIKEFTTSITKSTMMGYYYVTLEASIMFLFDVKDTKSLSKLTNEQVKSSFIKPDKNSFVKSDNDLDNLIIY